MIAFQWLTISIILIVLSLIHIDALKHRSARQTTINKCLTPDIPICDFVQCVNGRCVKDENSLNCYQCQCSPGYVGQLCDETIVLPSSCNPVCQNGGTCIMNGAAYTCSCATGWTGPSCDIPEHNCPIGFCQNGGTCRMNGMNPYCNCPTIYTGQRCETLIPGTTTTPSTTITTQFPTTCSSNPCLNGGSCFNIGNTFLCSCNQEWSGPTCSIPISTTTPSTTTMTQFPDTCSLNPCLNGGSCFNIGNTFLCSCNQEWSGPTCSIPISTATPSTTTMTQFPNTCSLNPCLNGGSCFNIGNTFVCSCKQEWSGPTCSILNSMTTPAPTTLPNVNPCNPNPCYNEGTCFRHGNSYVCVCKSQFTGSLCEVPRITTTPAISTIRCTSQPCQNGGTCFDSGNSYFCYCGPNGRYTGKNCEIVNAPSVSNCPLNCAPGYCVNTGVSQNAYACICNGVMTPTRCPLK
ncbi:unnamed protein product [Rotaria sordida]|uniref:EGF-like domain-containing protein n=1 Tax=Rotaria sordida TaxID=392033 RepID=A0A813TU87_9BILA|nr:unnamed protein product [Rotaria sordida]